jgi:hypothetical protein
LADFNPNEVPLDDVGHALDLIANALARSGLHFADTPTEFNGVSTPSTFGLPEVGAKYEPSKRLHNYLPRYDHVLGDMRHRVKKMVEIGVETDRSVRMWQDYFPNAKIIGIDIEPECKKIESDRIEIVIGDQTDSDFLFRFAKEHFGQIDVLVDDGVHTYSAIIKSFAFLYPALSSHGIYAVEDLIGHQYVPSLVSELTAAINSWPEDYPGKFWPIFKDLGPDAGWLARHTIGLEFYRYILFVKRGLNPRDNPFIMPEERYYSEVNDALAEVAAGEEKLRRSGRLVDEESLTQLIGFQLRNYVQDYLQGIKRYERDPASGNYCSVLQAPKPSGPAQTAKPEKRGIFSRLIGN